eukprot:694206-Rhodomonas_salina.2
MHRKCEGKQGWKRYPDEMRKRAMRCRHRKRVGQKEGRSTDEVHDAAHHCGPDQTLLRDST